MHRHDPERGMSVLEALILVAVVGLVFAVAVTTLHVAFTALPQSKNATDDLVHSIANEARAAIAYDPAAASKFTSASWNEDSATLTKGCTSSIATCVKITTTVSGSTLTISGQNLTSNESYSINVLLHQEASDPTSAAYTGL